MAPFGSAEPELASKDYFFVPPVEYNECLFLTHSAINDLAQVLSTACQGDVVCHDVHEEKIHEDWNVITKEGIPVLAFHQEWVKTREDDPRKQRKEN